MKADPLDQWGSSGDLLKDTGDHQSCATGLSSLLVFIMSTQECVCVLVCVIVPAGAGPGVPFHRHLQISTSLCRSVYVDLLVSLVSLFKPFICFIN